jgi:Nuclease-related domain
MSDFTDDLAVKQKDSPIKIKLLNFPGQSVDRQLDDFATEHFLTPVMIVCMLSALAGIEWLGYLTNAPHNPWGFSAMLVATLAIYGVGLSKRIAEFKSLKLGREGERAVAEHLNAHLDSSARIFHDVPIAHGNADHVIICTRGVYAVETKTRSKPVRRGAVVSVMPDHLKVDGYKPDRDPMCQARTAALDLHQILKTFTRKPVWVTPIVVFPGWSISDQRECQSSPWVLSAEEVPDRIARERESLSPLEVARLSRHLRDYVRACK